MSDNEIDEPIPTLNWEQPETTLKDGTVRTAPDCHLAFGYMHDDKANAEPVAALFVGESTDYILIPKDVLNIASSQGWRNEAEICLCSSCECKKCMAKYAIPHEEEIVRDKAEQELNDRDQL